MCHHRFQGCLWLYSPLHLSRKVSSRTHPELMDDFSISWQSKDIGNGKFLISRIPPPCRVCRTAQRRRQDAQQQHDGQPENAPDAKPDDSRPQRLAELHHRTRRIRSRLAAAERLRRHDGLRPGRFLNGHIERGIRHAVRQKLQAAFDLLHFLRTRVNSFSISKVLLSSPVLVR